jgi:UDP-glucuronate 4-epimerase
MMVLVTGAAGLISSHVAHALLDRGDLVVAVDSLSDYYEVGLTRARMERRDTRAGFTFHQLDVSDRAAVAELVDARRGIDAIVHLAAQAGVRHSMVDPYAYAQANVMGHLAVLEAADPAAAAPTRC